MTEPPPEQNTSGYIANNLVDSSGQICQVGFVSAAQFRRQESVVADLIEREPDLLEVHISFE